MWVRGRHEERRQNNGFGSPTTLVALGPADTNQHHGAALSCTADQTSRRIRGERGAPVGSRPVDRNPTVDSYLSGRTFSNSGEFRIGRTPLIDRVTLITDLARGKRVMHLGCADHLPLIQQKRADGSYLHDRIADVSQHLVGVDTNAAALGEMRAAGIDNLYLPEDVPADLELDLVVAPDVIEHVGNVEDFLKYAGSFGCPVLITTPNALRMENRTRFRSELVNTDHRYWFSPYTLARSVVAAGFTIDECYYTGGFAKRTPLRSLARMYFPVSRDGLAILATPAPSSGS